MNRRLPGSLVLLALYAFVSVDPVYARGGGQDKPVTGDGEALQEIVVQASRSQKPGRSTPLSSHVLDRDVLSVVKHRHIAEALVRAPGVWISRGNGQEHLTALRSPVLTGAGACGAFMMTEDAIPLRATGFCNVNQLFEAHSEGAERIEVLAGPQPVLYGSNALHGVINIVSPVPDQQDTSVLNIEAGGDDYYRSSLLHKGSIAGIGHRPGQHWLVSFSGTRDGGFKNHSGFDQQKLKLRHGLSLEYGQGDLSITTTASFSNLNQETAGFISGHEVYRDDSSKDENPNPEAYRDARSQRAHINFEYRPNPHTRWSLTPYVRHSEMEFLMHFLPWQPVERNRHTSGGWRLSLERDINTRLTLLAGLDGEATRAELRETQSAAFSPAIPAGVHYDYRVRSSVVSPFVSANYRLTEQLSLSAGLRQEWLAYDYDNRAAGASPCAADIDCRFARPADTTDRFNKASWQLGAVYAFSEDANVFLNLARGYRAPQTTELYRLQQGQLATDFDAETLDSIELGWRGAWRRWQLRVAAWYMDKEEVIYQNSERQTVSGALTRHQGLDIAATWTGDGPWYFSLNGSYGRHTYANQWDISPVSVDGNEIDTAPRYMGSAQWGYQLPGAHRVELEWVYMGSYYTDPENQHSYRGHRLFHLRWQWSPARTWKLGLRVHNLSDEDYAERADFGFGQRRYFVGEPRRVYIELSRQL